MGNSLSVRECVTHVYQAARDGSSNLTDLLKRLKTEQRKTALETKTEDCGHFVTPLIIAARNGRLNSVKILLGYGADIEARGTLKIGNEVIEGCTPLWAAASFGRLDVVKLLIEQNADVDGRTSTGSTPLRTAAFNGHLDVVRCLVESGADVNVRTITENTPLIAACYLGHLNVVIYLIDKGAFMDRQNKDGSTALHVAAQRGHLEIVTQLLALRASQLPNNQGLTPLLYACNECSIEMVECLINRPECTKEQRIDALELLGATIAIDRPLDTGKAKAFSYMKRGMEERYKDLAHPLLKTKMEPVEAYQNRKESQTLQELALLEGDDHAIGMEGLIIRERILGPDNPANLPSLIYHGAVIADVSEEYELSAGLWQRASEKAMNSSDVPITDVISCLKYQIAVFGEMVQKSKLLRPNLIEDAFQILVAVSEKQGEQLKSRKSQEGHENKEQDITVYYALYLLKIYTKVKVQNANMIDFLQRFLLLNPRTNDGNTLLHLAAWHETPIFLFVKDILQSVWKFPCVETMKLILNAGGAVNAVNTEGNTPLHQAVKFKPKPEETVILTEMLLLLLFFGSDTKLANKNCQTPVDSCETDTARTILSSKKRAPSAINVDVRNVRKF